jgi:hypothetical protein
MDIKYTKIFQSKAKYYTENLIFGKKINHLHSNRLKHHKNATTLAH